MRVINATLTHPSIDLLQNSSMAVTATKIDTVSDYANVPTGSPALQFNDTNSTTALLTTSATITGGQHYTLVAYDSGGTVKTNVLTADFSAPASGTGQLRIYDAAIDAGALDVYITAPGTDLGTVASPTTAFPAQTFAQSSSLLPYAPGTYQNFPVFAHHYYWRVPGQYLFRLTPHPLDTRLIPDGRYLLTVNVADICGNRGSLSERVMIANHV